MYLSKWIKKNHQYPCMQYEVVPTCDYGDNEEGSANLMFYHPLSLSILILQDSFYCAQLFYLALVSWYPHGITLACTEKCQHNLFNNTCYSLYVIIMCLCTRPYIYMWPIYVRHNIHIYIVRSYIHSHTYKDQLKSFFMYFCIFFRTVFSN